MAGVCLWTVMKPARPGLASSPIRYLGSCTQMTIPVMLCDRLSGDHCSAARLGSIDGQGWQARSSIKWGASCILAAIAKGGPPDAFTLPYPARGDIVRGTSLVQEIMAICHPQAQKHSLGMQ